MTTTESNNLLEVWDKLCDLIDQRGSAVRLDPNTKGSEQIKFNQIKLNRASALWQSIMAVLEPLSEEEIEVLLDLAKPNNTHTVFQSKFSMALFVSIPLGLVYLISLFIQHFHLGESAFLSGPVVGGFIGGAASILILGGYLLYKQLTYRWLSMELNTCLETALAMKKAERINFKKYDLTQNQDQKTKITVQKTAIKIQHKK